MSDTLQFAPEPGHPDHPDPDQLTAFAEHALPEHERVRTLAHLATCPDCRRIVFLAQPAEEELLPQPVPTRKPLFQGWALAWIAAGALAGAAILTVSLRPRPLPAPPPQQVSTARVETSPAPPAIVPAAPLAQAKAASAPRVSAPLRTPPTAPAKATLQQGVIQTQQAQLLPYSPFLRNRDAPALGSAGQPYGTVSQGSAASMGAGARVAGAGAPAHIVRVEPQPPVRAMAGMGASSPMATPAAPGKPAPVVMGAVADAAPAAPPPHAPAPMQYTASDTVTVSANSVQVEAETASNASSAILTGKDLDALADDPGVHLGVLPSHLPIRSVISNGARTVAIDARGSVFVSKDAGKRWDAVSASWTGRATQVSLALPEEGRAFAAPAAGIDGQAHRATVVGRADLSGSVNDSTGAAIPGATVRLEAVSGKEVQTAKTGQYGTFMLVNLAPGGYRLHVSAPGFQVSERPVELHAGDRPSVGTVLQAGAVSETVEVTNATAMIETKKKSTSKPAAFQLTTDTGDIYVSADGKSWKRR